MYFSKQKEEVTDYLPEMSMAALPRRTRGGGSGS
jgi:hypothetical protein